jgi:hypothetical protein
MQMQGSSRMQVQALWCVLLSPLLSSLAKQQSTWKLLKQWAEVAAVVLLAAVICLHHRCSPQRN